MSSSTEFTHTPEKVVELLETLIEQTVRGESRQKAIEQRQFKLMEQIQQGLSQLTGRTAATPSLERNGREKSRELRGTANGSHANGQAKESNAEGGLDWEQEKARLIDQFTDADDSLASTATKPIPACTATDDPKKADCDNELDWLMHLEQLDPQDPALHNDHARRELVAKLRKIEVQLSLERAQLARQRTELEERMIEFQHDQRIIETKQQSANSKDSRARWRFTRLFGS